jgi:peptidoglycan/xylan/chitin deacetylase (PgdA/CDA1 family)
MTVVVALPARHHVDAPAATARHDVHARQTTQPVAAQPVPVLMYHHIRVPLSGNAVEVTLTVEPARFAEQMALLRSSGWHTVSLAEVMAARNGGPLPPHPVVLTFDDGDTDFATRAEPIMRAVGFTGTAYVPSGMVGAPDHMSLDVLRAVAARGTVIAGHTVSHVNLRTVPRAMAERELRDSRASLQQWTGQPVDDFAYPYGSFNAATEALVAAAGYRNAAGICCGPVTAASDIYALPRVRVAGGDSLSSFAGSLGIGLPPPTDGAWWSRLNRVAALAMRGGEVGIAASPAGNGYGVVRWDGRINHFGDYPSLGSPEQASLAQPVVGATATQGPGYLLAAADGGVFSYGGAHFHGSMAGVRLNQPVVGIAAHPDDGYWLAAADGGVFSFGTGRFHGSAGDRRLNQPVIGMAATPDGGGYWLAASDGGVFSFGTAQFHGSAGAKRLNQPVVGMAATPDGGGYWLVAADGGVFCFGTAQFHGSTGDRQLNQPVVGMAATPDGGGYWLLAADGGVFNFGNAAFLGSAAA